MGVLVALVLAGSWSPARAADVATPSEAAAAAAGDCVLLTGGPVDLAEPVGNPECGGIRPGVAVVSDLGNGFGSLCTLAFMFRDAANNRYFVTAGHCVVGDGQTKTWAVGAGPRAFVNNVAFGRYRYASLEGPWDIGVIRVDAGATVYPDMCHFGGPTAMAAASTPPGLVEHYGQGRTYRDNLRARTGLAPTNFTANAFRIVTNAGPGDSGSPVLDGQGRAAGILVRAFIEPVTGNGVVLAEASRLDTHIARAAQAMGVTLTLATAPYRGAPVPG